MGVEGDVREPRYSESKPKPTLPNINPCDGSIDFFMSPCVSGHVFVSVCVCAHEKGQQR